MLADDGPHFFNDDGTAFNPDLIPVPDLCATCARNDREGTDSMACALTRADQAGEDDFLCFAYSPVSPNVDREAVLRAICARKGVPYEDDDLGFPPTDKDDAACAGGEEHKEEYVVDETHDIGSLWVRLEARTPLKPWEPNDDIIKYTVEPVPLDEGGEPLAPLGRLDVWRFCIGAYLNREEGPLFDLFDADSQEALDLHGLLFDLETQDWSPELPEGTGLAGTDLLYFQWAEFPPELRRSTIVLATAERAIQALGDGCGLAALWPWDNPYPSVESLTPDELLRFFETQKANEEFWGRIGFTRFGASSVLIRDLGLQMRMMDDAAGEGE